MNNNTLVVKNNERCIDALLRNNNIIKSNFHFEKTITYCIVQLAMQKVKINLHTAGLVIITKNEIMRMSQGKDKTIGINELINLIRKDLHKNNYFNLYHPAGGLNDIKQVLIKKTGITKDVFSDLGIQFDNDILTKFKIKTNYTIQKLSNLSACGTNQSLILYTLTQPYAKRASPALILTIDELRKYLHIAHDKYKNTSNLNLAIKRLCTKISEKTEINLTSTTLKKRKIIYAFSFTASFKTKKLKLKN